MDPIKVPKPPAKAFNPDRQASDLLRHQVRHLEWAVRHAGERRVDFHEVKDVKTEGEVAQRMQQLLPRLELAKRLPFSAATLEESPAGKRPGNGARRKAKSPARSRSKSPKRSKGSKRRSTAARRKRARAKR